ncbi:MAG: right-handed parallel beta-helix repeat-containing protein [Candidatus ainarchaeum sp.]|nr:right-handed parallel beta-helix repeat-containing protein [Candidatus ainarchaeum sp.]
MRKTALLLGLLLLASSALATNVSTCAILSSADTYVLNASLTGAPNPSGSRVVCILVNANDVVLDCNGFSITNNGTIGTTEAIATSLLGVTNLTIRNCTMSGYGRGIELFSSSNVTLANNTAFNNSFNGFYVFGNVPGNIIIKNTAYNNSNGFFISQSNNNTVANNSAYDNAPDYGFWLDGGSTNNTYVNNTAYGNSYGFYLDASPGNNFTSNTAFSSASSGFYFVTSSTDNVLTGNSAYDNSGRGFYLNSSSGNNLTGNSAYNNTGAGFVIDTGPDYSNLINNTSSDTLLSGYDLFSCSNNTLVNNTAYNHPYPGFYFLGNSGNNLTGNSAYNNSGGFTLQSGNNNALTNNSAYDGFDSGFSLNDAQNNTLANNSAYGINGVGFALSTASNNNNLTNNNARNNTGNGFQLTSSGSMNFTGNSAYGNSFSGFYLSSSSNNRLANNTAYDNLLSGFDLFSSNGGNFTNNTAYNNSNSGFYLQACSNNTLANNTARGSPQFGFYIISGSSGNNLTDDGAFNNTNGFGLVAGTGNTITGSTACNNTYQGFLLNTASDNNTIANNLACNNTNYGFDIVASSSNGIADNTAYGNNVFGFILSSANNNTFTNNTAFNNPNADFYIASGSYNNFTNNTAYNNSQDGFYLNSGSYNTFTNNTVRNTLYAFTFMSGSDSSTLINNFAFNNNYGFAVFSSPNNRFISNTAYNNSDHGASVDSGPNNTFTGEYYYNNAADFGVGAGGSAISVNLSNITFDNRAGSFQNFTSLSLNDSVGPGESYSIEWSSRPAPIPATYGAFANKFINISGSGAPSIDSIAWSWTDGELPGYNESRFTLWEYGAGWTLVNGTPDTATNTLRLSNLSGFSTFGILQFNDTAPPIVTLSSPANNSALTPGTLTFTFTAVDDTSAILNCSVFLDGASNQTNSSVLNGTPTSFVITGIALGGHNWSVACTDSSANTGTSELRDFSRVAEPSSPPPSSPECSVDADCSDSDTCIGGACTAVPCACGLVQNHQCIAYACCLDSQCPAGQICQNNHTCSAPLPLQCAADSDCRQGEVCKGGVCMYAFECASDDQCNAAEYCDLSAGVAAGTCRAVACDCGRVENHRCSAYACCRDSDCGEGRSCSNNACVLQPGPGGGSPPPVAPGGECNTSEQCMATQFCNNAACADVTGKCGYAAGHAWVTYACGPEPGCPLCPQGDICINRQCTPPALITVTGKDFVGENKTITVTYPSGPCVSCVLALSSPSGAKSSANTDANGQFNLTLNENGTYTVTLVRESRAVSILAARAPGLEEELPPATVIYNAIVKSQFWLMILLIIVVSLVVYLRHRGRSRGAEKEAPPSQ